MLHSAHIAGATLSNILFSVYSQPVAKRWLDLWGHIESNLVITDAEEKVLHDELVITGFGELGQTPPLGSSIVGLISIRRRCQHRLSYKEMAFLNGKDPSVLLLVTEAASEVGSSKIDYSLLQALSPGARPVVVKLVIANLIDSSGQYETLQHAFARHRLLPAADGKDERQDKERKAPLQPSVVTQQYRAATALVESNVQRVRELTLQLERLIAQKEANGSSPH